MTIFATMDPMTYLAAGYGVILLVAAYGIDLMARRASRSLESRQNPGFTYHESHDAWLCPEDQWLWPQSFDPENRIMRYRGSPSICNACPVKDTCTTSLSGREVRRTVDPWPASEAAKFHRGIACTVAGLGAIWPIATLLSGPGWADAMLLAAVTALILGGSAPLWLFLVRTKTDPTGILERSADANIEARKKVARAYDARRTTYRSERLANISRRDDILGDDLTPLDAYDDQAALGAGPAHRGTGAPRRAGSARSGSTARRSSWRDVAASIDAAGTAKADHHRYRSDRIQAEQDAITRAEAEAKSTA